MATKTSRGVELLVGGVSVVHLRLAPAALTQNVTVSAPPVAVETQSGEISNVVTQSAIAGLPLNGRRFTDLALLSPDVVQDPRGLTSDSNGDLSVGGVRGFQNSFLVDGADDNNSFFAQARGGYRAPYQFSNEVIQEFRVSKNSYSAELGRSGGAVFNVVTKSGTNNWHGTGFYYLRDRAFDAQQPYASSQPDDRQQQFGGTLGGPDPQRPHLLLCRLRSASADRALGGAVRQRRRARSFLNRPTTTTPTSRWCSQRRRS